jgi:hypothetical protein
VLRRRLFANFCKTGAAVFVFGSSADITSPWRMTDARDSRLVTSLRLVLANACTADVCLSVTKQLKLFQQICLPTIPCHKLRLGNIREFRNGVVGMEKTGTNNVSRSIALELFSPVTRFGTESAPEI